MPGKQFLDRDAHASLQIFIDVPGRTEFNEISIRSQDPPKNKDIKKVKSQNEKSNCNKEDVTMNCLPRQCINIKQS